MVWTRKLLLALVSGIGLLCPHLSSEPQATLHTTPTQATEFAAVKLSIADAMTIADQAVAGTATQATLIKQHNQWVYRVTIVDNHSGTWTTVQVEANQGKVIGMTTHRLTKKHTPSPSKTQPTHPKPVAKGRST